MVMQTVAALLTAAATAAVSFDIERVVLGHEVLALVEKLPDHQCKVMLMTYCDGMSLEEIEDETMLPAAKIRQIRNAALASLRTQVSASFIRTRAVENTAMA